jgi:CubicO group peptidase (beta-lactamase class C family)
MAHDKTGFAAGRLQRITEHLDRCYVTPGKIAGCQTLVARHGQVAYLQALGLADRERNKPIADDTIFRIYSMTKPITSVALMTLYERGYFSLQDPVHRVLPELRDQRVWVSGEGDSMQTAEPRRPVTFRDMLCHTSGLSYGDSLSGIGAVPASGHPVDAAYVKQRVRRGHDETLEDLVRKLGGVPLRYQPGERWMYSLSTDVCGALIERLTGKRLDQYFKEAIFEPLGMKDTAFSVAPDKVGRFAACYRRNKHKQLELWDDPQRSSFLQAPAFLSGGAGLTSTIHDYYRFCEMLRRGGELDGQRILGPRTVSLMHMNHLAGGKDLASMAIGSFSETVNEGVGFGLGFASTLGQVETAGPSAGDYYWGGLASTIFWIDPREQLVVIFMTQLVPSATFDFRGQLKNIIYASLLD